MLTLQPTALNAALLRACVGDADALHAWESQIDFAAHDDDGYLLLPLLKHRADTNGWRLQEAARISGFTRYWWTQNNLRLKGLSDILPVFTAMDIPVMGLDAVALALADYPAAHLRPIQRLDLLIPPDKQQVAYKMLRDAGWTAQGYVRTKQLTLHESLDFKRDDNTIRLHWYAVPRQTRTGIDDRLWQGAVMAQNETFGFSIRIPGAGDRLALRASLIADHWGKPCPALWRADAMQIIGGDSFDWDRAVQSAADYRRTAALHHLMAALSQEMGVGIPATILRPIQVSRLEKWELGAVELQPLDNWQKHVLRFAHRTHGQPVTAYPRETTRYLKLILLPASASRLRRFRAVLAPANRNRAAKETP